MDKKPSERDLIIAELKNQGYAGKIVGVSTNNLKALLNTPKNKAVTVKSTKRLERSDDRFITVKFLKPYTPYKKGDVVRLEKVRYEVMIKKDKLALTII